MGENTSVPWGSPELVNKSACETLLPGGEMVVKTAHDDPTMNNATQAASNMPEPYTFHLNGTLATTQHMNAQPTNSPEMTNRTAAALMGKVLGAASAQQSEQQQQQQEQQPPPQQQEQPAPAAS